MKGSRDDMVLRPRLHENEGSAPALREGRQVRGRGSRNRGSWARWLQRQARSIETRVAGKALSRLAARGARMRGLRSLTAGRAGAVRAGGGAGGAVAAAVVAAAIVAARLVSGRSFENMGASAEAGILGSMGPEAKAAARTRQHFQDQGNLATQIGRQGFIGEDVRAVARDIFQMHLREEKGRQLFDTSPEFQVNAAADIIILRGAEATKSAWQKAGGPEAIERFGEAVRQVRAWRGW